MTCTICWCQFPIVCLKVPSSSIVAWFSTCQQNFDSVGFKVVFKYTVRSSTMITMSKQLKQQGILNNLKAAKQDLQVAHYADLLSTCIHVLCIGADSDSDIKVELGSSAVETHVSLALYKHIPCHPIIIPLSTSLCKPSWSIHYSIHVSTYLEASICWSDCLESFILSLSFVLVI